MSTRRAGIQSFSPSVVGVKQSASETKALADPLLLVGDNARILWAVDVPHLPPHGFEAVRGEKVERQGRLSLRTPERTNRVGTAVAMRTEVSEGCPLDETCCLYGGSLPAPLLTADP